MFITSQKKFSIFFNQKFFNKMNNFKEEFAGFERMKENKAKGEKPSKREKKDKEIERRNERKRVGR